MFADSDDQNALPHLLRARDVVFPRAWFRDSPGNEGRDDERGERSDHGEPPRLEPRLPPCFRSLRQPRSNLLPNVAAVVRAGIRDRQGIESGEDRFDAVIGLFGMLNVLEKRRGSGTPRDDPAVIAVEGWMLGQVAS